VRSGRAPVSLVRFAVAMVAAAGPFVAGARAVGAQVTPVSIQLRPKVGDIFRTRLDQVVEVTGTTKHGGQDTTVTVRTDLVVLTHSRVERVDGGGATVLAVTDSVTLYSTGSAEAWMDQTMRHLRGQRLRIRIAPDGAVSLAEKPDEDERELQALVAQMPALLPRGPVTVGASWTRQMGVPVAGQPEASLGAEVVATFRLDSLIGDLAWISMSGTLQPTRRKDGDAMQTVLAGTVNGWVVVDRRRGWIMDARTMLNVRSTVAGTRTAPPMKFRMRIEQRLRAR
jgi:hypothetical protein